MLAFYNPKASTKLSADASSYRLGAVLFQQTEASWKPVAYASSALEERYTQIENEALAVNIFHIPAGVKF